MPDILTTYHFVQSQTTRTTDATSVPSRSLKRKKAAYAETSSDDDTPLASSPAKPKPKANGKAKPKQESSDTGDNFEPEAKPQNGRASNGRVSKPPKKKVKEESDNSDEDEDEDEDKPLKPAKRAAGRKRKMKAESGSDEEMPLKKTSAKSRGKKVKAEEASDAETPKPKRGKKANKEDADSKSPTKKGRKEKKEEEQEEVFRWWENGRENGDDSIKWTTLEHNGVLFPPPYEPLPSSVKMKYNGTSAFKLPCAMLNTNTG